MPKKKTPVPQPKLAQEILWSLLDGKDSPFIALRNRSVVMGKLLNGLEQKLSNAENEAFAAHARDLEAARCEVEQRLELAYRRLAGEPQESETSGGAR